MKEKTLTKQLSNRYRALAIFITLFVVSIISVLGLNFYISAQFENDALSINLAGRQRMLSQRTMKSLLNVQKAEQSGQDVNAALDELEVSFMQFDQTLTAFDKGGLTTNADGTPVRLNAVQIEAGRQALNKARQEWVDYREKVQRLLASDQTPLQSLADAIQITLASDGQLLQLMNELTSVLQANAAPDLYINLAGRQRMLSQRTAKTLFELALAQLSHASLEQPLEELRETIHLFDSTLTAFDEGGVALGGDGQPATLSAVALPEARSLIAQAWDIWRPLRERLVVITQGNVEGMQLLSDAIAVASANNLSLLGLMNDLTVALEADATRRSTLLRLIQVVGITVALIMFGTILFYFLRQLRKSDQDLVVAKAETDRILDTVKDGLFLMNKDYTIGGQHSRSLTRILDQHGLAGQNFLSILRKIVPEKTLKTAEDYLELLFGNRVNEDLVTSLNPLDEVEVYFDSGTGEHHVKHLEFSFKRARVGDDISHLLVQVDDISQRVKLERELKESQEKAQQQFDLMLNVLHVEPALLGEFLSSTENTLNDINAILRERSLGAQQNRVKLDRIFRMMHTIKGDAAGLELRAFEDKAHDFENILQGLRDKGDLRGGDFLSLTIKLDEFMNQIDSLRSLIQRLSDLQAAVRQEETIIAADKPAPASVINVGPHAPRAQSALREKLSRFTDRLAREQGKHVRFSMEGEEYLPERYRHGLHDVLTQFLRNAIVHGIESPEQREVNNKSMTGHISVVMSPNTEGGLNVIFRDDGCGLSHERIKEAAVAKGMISADKALTLDRQKIIGLIFLPGFSTADSVDKHAGRGVGMDVVAATIRGLGGKLRIRSLENKYCEFHISLPLSQGSDIDGQEIADAANDC